MTSVVVEVDPTRVALLASVTCLDREGFADQLVGACQRLMHSQFKAEAAGLSGDSVGAVLRALLWHQGWHSNRVWSSIERLAEMAGFSESQVKRVLAFLRKIRVLRNVTGEELLRGPGPHQYPVEERRGETKLPTCCYDLGGLLRLISGVLHDAVRTILIGESEKVQMVGEPAAAAPPAPPQPLQSVRSEPAMPSIDDLYPDPFEEKICTPEGVSQSPGSGTCQSTPVNDIPRSGQPASNHTATGSACNVASKDKPIGTPEKPANGSKKSPGSPGAEKPFPGPKMTPIKQKANSSGTDDGNLPIKRTYTYRDPGKQAAYDKLAAVGVDIPIRRQVLRERGADFAIRLAIYGRWRARVGDEDGKTIANMGGYLQRTYRQMEEERRRDSRNHDVWPEAFMDFLARELAAEARVLNNASPPVATPPVATAVTGAEPGAPARPAPIAVAPSTRDELDPSTLPAGVRAALLPRAMEEAKRCAPTGPAGKRMRDLIDRRQWDSAAVRRAAQKLLEAEDALA